MAPLQLLSAALWPALDRACQSDSRLARTSGWPALGVASAAVPIASALGRLADGAAADGRAGGSLRPRHGQFQFRNLDSRRNRYRRTARDPGAAAASLHAGHWDAC